MRAAQQAQWLRNSDRIVRQLRGLLLGVGWVFGLAAGSFFYGFESSKLAFVEERLGLPGFAVGCVTLVEEIRWQRVWAAVAHALAFFALGMTAVLLLEIARSISQRLPARLFKRPYHASLFSRIEGSYLKWQRLSILPLLLVMGLSALFATRYGVTPLDKGMTAGLSAWFAGLGAYGLVQARGGLVIRASRPFLVRYTAFCLVSELIWLTAVLAILLYCYPRIIELLRSFVGHSYYLWLEQQRARIANCVAVLAETTAMTFAEITRERAADWTALVAGTERLLQTFQNPQILIWGIAMGTLYQILFPMIRLQGWKVGRLFLRFLGGMVAGFLLTLLFQDVALHYRLAASVVIGFTVTLVLSIVLG